jgi:hypothetical protein
MLSVVMPIAGAALDQDLFSVPEESKVFLCQRRARFASALHSAAQLSHEACLTALYCSQPPLSTGHLQVYVHNSSACCPLLLLSAGVARIKHVLVLVAGR